MTYNFDPDKWYENEFYIIESKLKSGQMNQREYEKAVDELDRKNTDMWRRLDGSDQLPKLSRWGD